MRFLFLLFCLLGFSVCSVCSAQENSSLKLLNNNDVVLSPLNKSFQDSIIEVKTSKVVFSGTFEGIGKANHILVNNLSRKKSLPKVRCSFYINQDGKNYYIRSTKFLDGKEIHTQKTFEATYYEVFSKSSDYKFLIITKTKKP